MRKHSLLAFSVVAVMLMSGSVLADAPGADWISQDKVRSILKQDGYTQVTELEADDGHWEGEGVKDGERHEFHVDAHSGQITKDEVDRDD